MSLHNLRSETIHTHFKFCASIQPKNAENWESKIETAVEADLEEKVRIPGPPWQSLSFRPSHARLPAVVASDFVLTPWIVLVLHPVRCTYATSSDLFPRRVTDRTALPRYRYRLASTSTAAYIQCA